MDRRDFLRNTALVSIGGILFPSAFLSSCRKETLFEDSTFGGKVLVIGAGAAGLYAGYILNSKGIDFEILEASSRYGGRLGKNTSFADFPLDLGAQWLHGKNNLMGDLVAKSGAEITLDDSEIKYWFNNSIVSSLPNDVVAIFLPEDLPDVSYKDYAAQKGFGPEYDNIVEGIAGDSGADASELSAYWQVKEENNWVSGEEDYKFRQTYFDVIDSQIASVVADKIRLNTAVTKIDYSGNEILVTDANNNTHAADKMIITVPVSILKLNTIEFIPALPSEKTNAFAKIGMDAGMKVFLKFSSRFYDQNIIGGAICAAYADEFVGKTGNDHVLLAFVMGEQAEYLSSLGTDTAIISALLGELDTMYSGQATATYLSGLVQNWGNEPFIRGAYSFSTVGMGNAREVAAQPVDAKLFFAGEAMNVTGHHQTVFGAIETGYREVINILKEAKK